jgi:hypothetical protein
MRMLRPRPERMKLEMITTGLAGLAGLAGRRKREEMRAPRARRDEDPLGCMIDNSESRFPSGSLVNTSQIPYQA